MIEWLHSAMHPFDLDGIMLFLLSGFGLWEWLKHHSPWKRRK